MSIVLFVLFGFVAGLLARAIMPGRQSMGFFMTAILGIVGSFIGGFLGSMIGGESILQLHSSGLIGSVVGALIVLAIMGSSGRRRATI